MTSLLVIPGHGDLHVHNITTRYCDIFSCVDIFVDVAEWVMNRSIYCHSVQEMEDLSQAEGGRNAVVEYSFQFLEDFREECPKFPILGMKIFKHIDSPRYVWGLMYVMGHILASAV